ncbi:YadA-like family protein [Phascolarctobacterium succinatutens]|uniref:YadA-like family protein n=3 Tax=Phascolarctobacterium succinatutens TaxID=626940 RepID=UPI003AF6F476
MKEISEVAENANQGWNLSTNGGEASKVAPGETVDFSGDQNINISNDGTNVKVELKNDIYLAGDDPNAFVNISGSKGTIWATGSVAAGNVVMDGTTATVSGLGNTTTAYADFANGKGKAATEEQLKEISEVAENANQGWNLSTNGGEASKVAPGETVDFSGDKNINIRNDGTNVKVKLNDDIDVKSVQTNVLNAKYNLSVGTANENGTVPFFVNSNGSFYAANGKLVVDKDGKLVAPEAELGKVTADEGEIGNVVLKDGVFYKNTALRDGELYVGDADGNYSQITTKGAKLGKVTVAADGKISGVAAGAVTADSTDAVNGSQLHAVATEAGKHSKVVSGNNINVEETDVDGQKFYKVNMNKDIMLGDLTGKNVSISGTNGTIETTGYIATKDRVYADKGAKLADIDVTGNKISNGASSIVLDGSNVKVNDKVTIDQNGNIAGVNSVQTNALNAKYNLSVGTANENGTVPFFVNSNGAFYAANGKLVVDKDGKLVAPEAELGKVTADEGVIGNVVLKDGVFYKNSALRDGELFIGDADGNYSQITTKGAKLGKVTIDEKGNIAGVNHIQTNALNAKYNLSVGTANANGIMPFFVNSNGAFYGANNNFSVDKDGKVIATAGEIGNVVLNNGVFTGHSALRDGELFVGDASGNYSQITTKGAKLGKVTVAADGKISGVAAGAVTADSTDAVNGSQLHAVATEAGKHSKVVNGSNINVEEFDNDGQKIYKVNLNKDIILGDLTGKYVNISGTNGTIETTGYIATQDRVYADKGAKLADIDVAGNKISNGASSIVLDGSNVKVNDKVTIDQNGNIAGVNSLQTNALNAKYNLSVGTANENGIMPFFVNSNGAFYGANNNFSVDKDGKVTATAGEIGNVVLQNGVYTGHSALRDGELFVGDASGNYSQITTKGAKLGKVTVAEDGKISGVAAGAVTADSTDAVNGSQLHAVATEAGKHSKVVNGSNINVEETDVDGQKIYKVNLNKDIMLGDLTGKYVNISGTNGTIETTGYIATKDRVYADKGAKLADIDVTGNTISNGDAKLALNGAAGTAGMINGKGASVYMQDGYTVINSKVAFDQNGKISGVAAGEVSSTSTDAINGSQLHQTNENVAQNKADIAANRADIDKNKADIAANRADIDKNKADIAANRTDIDKNKADIKTLDTRVTDVEALAKKHTTVTAGDNITVTEDTNKDGGKEYKVALDKDIKLDSVTTGQTVMNNDGLKVGDKVSVTATAVTAGKTSISDEGVKVGDKTYISDKGLNANDQKVTNVAAGEISATSKDAVNGSQLYATNQEVANNTNRINQLGSRVNKVGAGAAALAALHPMDFDPDDKLTFSAGYGNYGGENAAAIGAYYRPDEKVMFSVGGTVGNGENMVNAGVSFALDRTNHVSNSRTALAREVIDLRGQLAVMGAKMAKMEKAFGMLDETKTKLFPDVPANHWAYEYIAKLAGNGYIEGYPDGNFGGDRLMTRYEFAAMLYRAIENGAALEEKIIKEFEPELGRIRVDRISGEDGDRDKIERVRVNDTKGERDHYGNKLAK